MSEPEKEAVMRLLNRSFLLAALAGSILSPATAQAQTGTGRIVGRVVDAATGQPISGAQLVVSGTRIGVLSNVDGRYMLMAVPAGARSIAVTYIGYAPKTVEGIEVAADRAVAQDITLQSSAIALEEITVTAARETGSVNVALDQQRTAIGVMSATTLEQIAKSPDSDAAQAVQRVSGVTVQDGKYVFVRGLGERYTTTSLNGARVPSPEPEKKVVPLDLFPSNLLENITTSKTFTPDQPGDFSGAQVNLKTRSFPARRMVQVSLSGGYNARATGNEIPTAATVGGEWLGMAADNRRLPAVLTSTTDFARLSQNQINGLIRSLPRDWSFQPDQALPNLSGSLSFGGEDPILFGHRVGYVGSISYSRSQEVHEEEIRSRAVPADAAGTPMPYNQFVGSTGQSGVLWGGLLNLSTYVGHGHKLELHNTYDRTADNEAHLDWGRVEEFPQVDSVRRTSLRYVERTVRSNQLHGEHLLNDDNKVEWSFTSSGVTRSEPDRADIAYGYEFAANGQRLPLAWLGFIPEGAKRTVGDLTEDALNADLSYTRTFGSSDRQSSFEIGGAYRHTDRDATSASYNLRALGLGPQQRAATPDQLFYGAYTEGGASNITLEPNSSGGAYNAKDQVGAGYAMTELPLGSSLRLIGGARVERWDLDMTAEPTNRRLIRIARTNTDVLPSLALNAKLGETQNLRLSASQTLARPEYRELAPISYRDMLGDREVFGDSSLVRTLVQNYDARWEWYPSSGEVLSIGLFAKRFDKPIEAIDVATSGASQLSFINAESATNYGVELEVRKGLEAVAEALAPFSIFANTTLMHSRINTSNSNLSALSNDERPMVGQAPYVVNAGLSYATESGATSATLLYNVVGRRIASAAIVPLNADVYEEPRQLLDFSIRLALSEGTSAKLDAKNLLDSAYEERQGDVIRHRYRTGRSVTLGLSWKLQ
jgi:hypothetical protein